MEEDRKGVRSMCTAELRFHADDRCSRSLVRWLLLLIIIGIIIIIDCRYEREGFCCFSR